MRPTLSLILAGSAIYFALFLGYVAFQGGLAFQSMAYFGLTAGVEEFVFRGVILRQTAARFGNRWALLVSSVAFALVHLSVPELPMLLLWGLMLGCLYLLAQSIWPCVLVHAAHNIFFMSVRTANSATDMQTSSADVVLGSAGVLNLILFALVLWSLRRQHQL